VGDQSTLWFRSALLADGWADDVRIRIVDGRIAEIRRGERRGDAADGGEIALPGLANLHSHAFQRAMAGLTERRGADPCDDFWSWRAQMYRFLDALDPQDNQAIAALAYAEMLESGFTRVVEFHYLHHDPKGAPYANPAQMGAGIAAAAAETGIGLTLAPVFYAHSDFGGAPPTGGQWRFVCSIDMYADLLAASERAVAGLSGAVIAVAPHSLRAVTEEELSALVALAGDRPIHIHVAEQQGEVRRCLEVHGRRPVELLFDLAQVGPRWCLVHATHVEPSEVSLIARSGAVAGLCPITEGNLGDGVFPADEYAKAGGRFGVGADSNVRIDAAEELRMLEYVQRLTLRRRNVLAPGPDTSTGRGLFEQALKGGAQAAGVAAPIGLAAGASADIVSLKADDVHLVGRRGDPVLDSWIFSAGRSLVDGVWVGGRAVVHDGRHVRRSAIERAYVRTVEKIL
jgi:formiminoglutamate deiminase